MPRILTIALPEPIADAVGRRLAGASARAVATAEEALAAFNQERWDLVIADGGEGMPLADMLARGRGSLGLGKTPVIVCLAGGADMALVARLVNELGVQQLLFHPLDVEELLRQASGLLKVALQEAAKVPDRAAVSTTMAAIWERFKDATMKRVGVLEDATHALLRGALDGDERLRAEREAHKLRGSLGTFGFVEGARLAEEIDQIFQAAGPLSASQGQLLSEMLVSLRQELQHSPVGAPPAAPAHMAVASVDGLRRILIVDDDDLLAEQLLAVGRARNHRPERAASLEQARSLLDQSPPDAILLDLSFPSPGEDGRTLLAELAARRHAVPVFILTSRDSLVDRLEVARLGGAAYLQKPMAAEAVYDVVEKALARRVLDAPTVLAVDDDPQVLATIEALLGERGLHVHTLNDPLQFWVKLAEVKPDLLVLDVDMPYLSGIELCRVVRNDPRLAALPVLFLTARTDPATIQRVFATGADDYVSKPILGPELVTRIANRLERMQLLKQLAESQGR